MIGDLNKRDTCAFGDSTARLFPTIADASAGVGPKNASQLIDAGVDVVTISKRLGHSSPKITLGVYAHLFSNNDERAAQAVNEALARW